MARELRVNARTASRLKSVGTGVPVLGAHIRPETAINAVDAGNSDSFTVPEGTDYLDLWAAENLWYRISAAGGDAVVDQDEFLPGGSRIQVSSVYEDGVRRPLKTGDILTCVVDT